ncbi:MAG: response regulator [Sporolactobacillus sp.]|jgi:two-component system response regulator YesN|nr:response regulator [Sporolactobacillus sp.]MCI1880745.1 response regulator [Sporolactobacillus sp.]
MKDILFIDDDISMKFIVNHFDLFHHSNYKIKRFVTDGLKALKALESDHFDIVITDIKMPIVDGITLIRKMRERNDETFVIIESTYREFRLAQEALRYRAIDYLEKPLTEEKLHEALKRVDRIITETKNKGKKRGQIWGEKMTESLIYYQTASFPQLLLKLTNNKKEIFTDLKVKNDKELLAFLWTSVIKERKYLYNDCLFMSLSSVEKGISRMLHEIKRLDGINSNPFILKIAEIIANNAMSEDLISLLSGNLGLSKDYLSRMFRQTTGITLKDYIVIRKIAEAQKLLIHSNKKVYQISEDLGYSSVDYFTKIYKRISGETPTQYRKHPVL